MPRAYIPESANNEKWCTSCGTLKSVDDFDLDITTDDGRKPTCKECRALIYAEDKSNQVDPRLLEMEKQAVDALAASCSGGSFAPTKDEMVDSLMRIVGGHQGFMRLVMAHYYRCKPGSAQRTRTLDMLMRMIMSREERGGALTQMSEADLKKLFVDTVKEQPNLLGSFTLEGYALPRVPGATVDG